MRIHYTIVWISFLTLLLVSMPTSASTSECIVLLHGMGRSKLSMQKAESYFKKSGFLTENIDYPSTRKTIESLANDHLSKGVERCQKRGASKIHFFTHSLGGIIVRKYLQNTSLPLGGRVVMLSPPNDGSQLAETLREFFLYKLFTGPAGQQLGTGPESLPKSLKPVDLEIGVIAGTRSFEPWFSLLIDGIDDGKVSVDETRLKEAVDFITIPASHTFIMMSDQALDQAKHYFRNGEFQKTAGAKKIETSS